MVHVISLTPNVRKDDVCFRWITPAFDDVCFAIDNIIVTDVANRPSSLDINFDSFHPADWIFFPGGFFQVCRIQSISIKYILIVLVEGLIILLYERDYKTFDFWF